ncbi:unnamed protein product [Oppiella nova]|uniref:protein-tyrosine-phosphatase n=1 Tax=Oppiella nova TaxID=334625 RepID=A0A7R9QAF3_9ACAR|nr:unnamed protein product [Oppiella nova]CAG2160864.1 unnamed protein product [Oppiella nova]
MACNERESGKYKCESYWPQDNDDPQQYGNITVQLVKWRQVCPDFLVRTLKVNADSIERTVCQFHYQTWPDHGVPNSVHPILELVRLMRDVQISETRPILIHCSAGCGRTGTLCSIDYVWALLRNGKLREDFSLYSIIREMRRQRIAMVQTLEQYMLCYKAVATLFEQQLKMIDSHTYENIDGDGEPLMRRQLLRESADQHIAIATIAPQTDHSLPQTDNTKSKHIPESILPSLPNSPSSVGDEVRHERLIGKATVIRRPSIAKLKAIFENQNVISTEGPIVRSRSTSSSLNRSQSIKERIRNTKSMIESNDHVFNGNQRHEMSIGLDEGLRANHSDLQFRQDSCLKETTYGECNPQINAMNRLNENSAQMLQTNHFNGSVMESFAILSEQKLLENHQQLQQEIRQHIQQKQLQSVPSVQSSQPIHRVVPNLYSIESQMQNNNSIPHQISSQMGPPLQMTINAHIQSQPLPPPPKPPRTYQYHHMLDGTITSLPNTSDGRLIVSVALPRRQPNELTVTQQNHYEPIGQRGCNISAPNLVSDTLLVNTNNMENFNSFNINQNNAIKVLNVSNNNIYESVLPKYRRSQPLEATGVSTASQNQSIHSYYDIMKLRNPGLNSTLPFYDSLYGRHGFMTVSNVRHISVPAIAQIQCPYPQFKPNYEAIYSNTNSNTNQNNVKNSDKKDKNINNNLNTKPNIKKESIKKSSNIGSNAQNVSQESTSGTFSKLSNAFRGLRIKSSKPKSNSNTTNSPASNSPIASRPPHSHRFSPPTQWTQATVTSDVIPGMGCHSVGTKCVESDGRVGRVSHGSGRRIQCCRDEMRVRWEL